MSKKHDKATAPNADPNADQNANAGAAPSRRGGRKPMTEAEKLASKAKRDFKKIASAENFTDPALWATLPPEVLLGVEKACIHVRTVIHAQEREALKARLAALEGGAAPAQA